MRAIISKITIEMTPKEAQDLDAQLGWLLDYVPSEDRGHFITHNGQLISDLRSALVDAAPWQGED